MKPSNRDIKIKAITKIKLKKIKIKNKFKSYSETIDYLIESHIKMF